MIFPTFTLLHMGVLPLLAGEDGVILLDGAAHKSMQEAATLARGKGTKVRTFNHGSIPHLRSLLEESRHFKQRIIVVDGVYSMSGEIADVRRLQEIAIEFDAILYIDDAHGFGVLGENPDAEMPFGFTGNGVVQFQGCTYENIFYVGGLTKAYSTPLAFITCPSADARMLFSASSTAIFGHSVPMATIAEANACLDINETEGAPIRDKLWHLTSRFIDGVRSSGLECDSTLTPAITVVTGDLTKSIAAAQHLWQDGFLLTPAVFPAAPIERGGMRFAITASHTTDQVDAALESLARFKAANSRTREAVISG